MTHMSKEHKLRLVENICRRVRVCDHPLQFYEALQAAYLELKRLRDADADVNNTTLALVRETLAIAGPDPEGTCQSS